MAHITQPFKTFRAEEPSHQMLQKILSYRWESIKKEEASKTFDQIWEPSEKDEVQLPESNEIADPVKVDMSKMDIPPALLMKSNDHEISREEETTVILQLDILRGIHSDLHNVGQDQPAARISDPRPPGDQRGDHGHLWLLHHDHCSRREILLAVPCHCAHTYASSSSHWTLGSSDEGHVDETVLDDEPDVDSRRISKAGTPGAKAWPASGSEDGEDLGSGLLLHHQEHDHQGVWHEPALHLPPGEV